MSNEADDDTFKHTQNYNVKYEEMDENCLTQYGATSVEVIHIKQKITEAFDISRQLNEEDEVFSYLFLNGWLFNIGLL